MARRHRHRRRTYPNRHVGHLKTHAQIQPRLPSSSRVFNVPGYSTRPAACGPPAPRRPRPCHGGRGVPRACGDDPTRFYGAAFLSGCSRAPTARRLSVARRRHTKQTCLLQRSVIMDRKPSAEPQAAPSSLSLSWPTSSNSRRS